MDGLELFMRGRAATRSLLQPTIDCVRRWPPTSISHTRSCLGSDSGTTESAADRLNNSPDRQTDWQRSEPMKAALCYNKRPLLEARTRSALSSGNEHVHLSVSRVVIRFARGRAQEPKRAD